jgi:hypothetical protein
METVSIAVAYGCRLSSVIDWAHFLALLQIDTGEPIDIIGARGVHIIRGRNDKDALMKNCAILTVKIDDTYATVKVFKQYLHFCKVNEQQAIRCADYLCDTIIDAQNILNDEELLSDRLDILQEEGAHITPETRDEAEKYLRTVQVCALDLTHEPIKPTMTNHTTALGCFIHTAKLARLMKESNMGRWRISYDNSLSLAIRILVPYENSIKEGYNFTIQHTGNILYSSNLMDDEATAARDGVKNFVLSKLDLIRLD